MDNDTPQEVDLIPLGELAISARLRQELRNAGITDLRSAFQLSDLTLVHILSEKTESEFDEYYELMRRDPEKLRARLRKSVADSRRTFAPISPSDNNPVRTSLIVPNSRTQGEHVQLAPTKYVQKETVFTPTSSKAFARLPNQPFSETLKGFEKAAKRAFDNILSHSQTAIVAETFPFFDLKISDYRDAWIHFFVFYGQRDAQTTAFDIIESLLPCSFPVFVADAARRLYDGRTLWENVFEELGIRGRQTSEMRFKSIFFHSLRRLNLQIYEKDEATLNYKYTALLHAGLSEEAWFALWEDTLIPLAKEKDYRTVHDGYDILNCAIESDGSLAVRNLGVRRMLARAPQDLLAPLLEAGLRTARQWQSFEHGFNSRDTALVSSEGISSDAMRALMRAIEENGNQSATSGSSQHKTKRRLFWINDPTLLIDIMRHDKPVCLRIEGQRLSSEFSGREFEVYLNGNLIRTLPVKVDYRGCLLPHCNLWVDLAEQYMVDVKLIEVCEGIRHEVASKTTNFLDKREGVFEFVGAVDNTVLKYQNLRRIQGKAIRRAYIVYPGYSIRVGYGATLVPTLQMEGDFSVTTLDMEEGGSAHVVDSSGDEVLWLQERFAVRIDKTWLIGKIDGKDLFGSLSSATDLDYNPYLPSIEVEAPGIADARTVLDVTCTCDGRRVYPRVKLAGLHLMNHMSGPSNGSRLLVDLALTLVPTFIHRGRLLVVMKTTGETVLDYRFGAIPLKGLRLAEIRLEANEPIAKYVFTCTNPILIEADDGSEAQCIQPGEYMSFERPLSNRSGRIRIEKQSDSDGAVDIDLMLAGMSIRLPASMENDDRTLSLQDFADERQDVSIIAYGDRSWGAVRRGFFMSLEAPLAFDDSVETATEITYSLSDIITRMRRPMRVGGKVPVTSLRLSVSYGWPERIGGELKSGDAILGYVRHGIIDDVRLAHDAAMKSYVRLLAKSELEWLARINYKTASKQFEYLDEIPDHRGYLALSSRATRLLKAGRDVELEITPMSLLQLEPDWNIVQVVNLANREKPNRQETDRPQQTGRRNPKPSEGEVMGGKNIVRIEGRVKRDANAVHVGPNLSVMDFCLMVPEPPNGEKSVYVDCFATSLAVKQLDAYVTEGEMIGIDGHLTFRSYTDPRGFTRSAIVVYADSAYRIGS